jgi:probable HAF family extracellular repeat protein
LTGSWIAFGVPTVGNLGGTFSFVSGLNGRGQMTGTMTLPGDSTNHPFFWDRGNLADMGTLGGDFGVPNAINESGEVVGFASNQGNQAALAFLWRQGVIANLGTADGDSCSAAHSINSRGQVVGESSPSCFDPLQPLVHAFLWENGGPMVDLNALVPPGSELDSAAGVSINDRGEIDGDRILPNGESHAFLLIPCDENHPDLEGCDYSLVDADNVTKTDPAYATRPTSAPTGANGVPIELRQRVLMTRRRNRFESFAPPQ